MSDNLLISGPFVAYLPDLGRLLGNVESAIILQHIHFRSCLDRGGLARISQQQISEDTGILLRTVERRLKGLRDEGYVEAVRASAFDATLVYRIDYARLADSTSPR